MTKRRVVWRKIDGEPAKRTYEVSSRGDVRSVTKKGKRHVLAKGVVDGYYCVRVYGKTQRVHRLVAEAFIDNPNNYPVVNHKDYNRKNNNVENLEWCTSKYNAHYSSERMMKPHLGARTPNTGERYIHKHKTGYRVRVERAGLKKFDKSYPTLEQAIESRDRYLRGGLLNGK